MDVVKGLWESVKDNKQEMWIRMIGECKNTINIKKQLIWVEEIGLHQRKCTLMEGLKVGDNDVLRNLEFINTVKCWFCSYLCIASLFSLSSLRIDED